MILRNQRHVLALAALLAVAILSSACEKVPFLAPTGSTITLTSATTALPTNGTAQIVAQVLESSGTPPHSGTRVTSTTTLGIIDPAEVSTDASGRATVTFRAGGQSGVAIIAAASGAATTGSGSAASTTSGGSGSAATTSSDRNLRIAVGAAAVGRVVLGASPTLISSQGGNSLLTAAVTDINGNALAGVPVIFTTTGGTLAASSVITDVNGTAVTTLNTSVEAKVTATAGIPTTTTGGGGTTTTTTNSAEVTIKVNPVPTLSITVDVKETFTVGSPISFTVTTTLAKESTSQIRSVDINFGDATTIPLGANNGTTSVQHVYSTPGNYTVTVTLTDTLNSVTSASTAIVVLPQPSLAATISVTKAGTLPAVTATFTATVTPATATVSSYIWDFGPGEGQATTTAPNAVHTYTTAGVRTVTVFVTTSTGQNTTGITAVSIP